MRANTLKRKLAAGQKVCGVFLEFNNPDLLELFGHLGYDFVFLDGQHCGLTLDSARNLVRAADLTGMTSIVRVPRNEPSVILEYLELGAGGIVVPNITTGKEAAAAAAAMRYPPTGTRGGFGRSRAANYGFTETQQEYFTQINAEILCWALVEDQAALPHLTEICGTPGVDVVAVGPGDMALSMGVPGGWKDPGVLAAVGQILAASRAGGKPASIPAGDPTEGRAWYAQGFQIVLVSALSLLGTAAKNFRQALTAS
jgi:4-hydroxy-2-oxoheptanedioate aldolase